MMKISFDNAQFELTEQGPLMKPEQAKQVIPEESGLYSIFIDSPEAFPDNFRQELYERETNLIYLGKAKTQTLGERLIEQDLSGKGPSSFFRSIGAVLGYKPGRGSLVGKSNQNNYVFTAQDKRKIIDWIDCCIRVRWHAIPEAEFIDCCEKHLIKNLCPLLNLNNNPKKFEPLKKLRKECLEIARNAE